MSAAKKRNPLKPTKRKLQQRKVIRYLSEGVTEEDYLAQDALQKHVSAKGEVSLKRIRRHPGQTDPSKLVREMRGALAKSDVRPGDEAWIIIDVDTWTSDQMQDALTWEREREGCHVAISNPKFELFLVMHFEQPRGCSSAPIIDRRLKHHWPNYCKRVPPRKFDLEEIRQAVAYASAGCTAPDNSIPAPGQTTVYRLIKRLTKD